MSNHQHLVEVVVGRILEKYNATSTNDLSITDQEKVKSTVLDIQTEVDKFLKSLDMETVGNSIGNSFDTSQLKKNLLNNSSLSSSSDIQENHSQENANYFEKPATARITKKRSPNMFVNRRRF